MGRSLEGSNFAIGSKEGRARGGLGGLRMSKSVAGRKVESTHSGDDAIGLERGESMGAGTNR